MVFVKLLGTGTYGSVSLYKQKGAGGKTIYLAVKTSLYLHANSLQTEIEILTKLKDSPRIIQVYGKKLLERLDDKGNKIYKMLMEYAPGGSLSSLMNSFTDKKLPDSMIREFTYMILEGLVSIHDLDYVHCDLTPENILVFPSNSSKCGYELKITDFGLSRREGDYKWWSLSFRYAGTSVYMSPESVAYGETGKELDLWSLGCIVLEMYTGKRPWWHTNYDPKGLMDFQKPLIPNDLPRDVEYFVNTCLSLYKVGRTKALSLLDHDFVRATLDKEEN